MNTFNLFRNDWKHIELFGNLNLTAVNDTIALYMNR